jgi:uncharacterized protein (DUF983 family)
MARRSLLRALLRQRCPTCREGRLFCGVFRMNDPCPVCGRILQREEGYFLGAMYFSYALALGVLVPLYLGLALLLPEVHSATLAALATLLYLPMVPAVFRYSRVIWLVVDELVSPGRSCEAPYEKARRAEIERRDA